MRPRIGIVLTSVPAYSETFFSNKIKGLMENGIEVILFASSTKNNSLNFPFEVKSLQSYNKGLLINLFYVFTAFLKAVFINPVRSLKLIKYELNDGVSVISSIKNVLICQPFLSQQLDWIHFGFGTLAIGKENVAKVIQAKMAVSFRGYDLYITPLKDKNYYKKLFSKEVKYHVLSNEMRLDLEKRGLDTKSIKVITPAIDTQFFKSDFIKKNINPIQILTVARLHWKKGLEYTLEALSLLKKSGIDFQYNIIGSGEELERLIFAMHQLDIADCVNILGSKTQDEIRTYMEHADIYLQYSIQEGFCNAVLEAQAMSLLCIVSNAEGLQENVLNNQTGWVIPKRQPQKLAQKIIEICSLTEREKSKIRSNARLRVENNFNLNEQKKKFMAFYFD